jgi:hypothetical protein
LLARSKICPEHHELLASPLDRVLFLFGLKIIFLNQEYGAGEEERKKGKNNDRVISFEYSSVLKIETSIAGA